MFSLRSLCVAPTNDAFAALPAGTLDDLLLPENKDRLANILKYHVVAANVLSSSLESGNVTTLLGDAVAVDVSDAGVKINGASVVTPDIIASNGIVHVIDKVLLPPADSAEDAITTSPASIFSIANSTADFSTLGECLTFVEIVI